MIMMIMMSMKAFLPQWNDHDDHYYKTEWSSWSFFNDHDDPYTQQNRMIMMIIL